MRIIGKERKGEREEEEVNLSLFRQLINKLVQNYIPGLKKTNWLEKNELVYKNFQPTAKLNHNKYAFGQHTLLLQTSGIRDS